MYFPKPNFSEKGSRYCLVNRPQHSIRGADDLRVGLVGALRGDHRHQLFNYADVGILYESLIDTAQPVGVR
jgi:hypothetical protein